MLDVGVRTLIGQIFEVDRNTKVSIPEPLPPPERSSRLK